MSKQALTHLISFVAGIIFSIGLIVSQMINPNKVVAFLRVSKQWDISLALVMGAAVIVAMPAFLLAKHRQQQHLPAFDGQSIKLPDSQKITLSLVLGSVLFGIGWGLLGYCPAPALVAAIAGSYKAVLFLVAMFIGFWLNKTIFSPVINKLGL